MDGKTQAKDLTGQKFGCRTVIRRDGFYRNTTRAAWLCKCDLCGEEKSVEGSSLRRLGSGCRCVLGGKVVHGKSSTHIHRVWLSMRERCRNPSNTAYCRYGGRGVSVCDRWQVFENFYADMGDPPPGMTIDRVDNNGNYTKENCRWATRKEQANNTRRNVVVDTPGGQVSMKDAAKIVGITYAAMQKRRALGMSGAELMSPRYGRLTTS